ncbi:GNAT family N-acetyltransferase [Pedobacter sp. CFBP9032]|uniref:GNAT family N-acetyltransferase n=1 Tax=Pedobacter sp. CFBP9032 TaxID=3096539 RepID=UPI002A6A5EA1|nr:GNAT family N-acetyltransferase [Pedobacter sp. CFBP9032]MDY0907037.1 GNAT family N-acetyltransferase [Pedobacter sp. CFBP9032]
MIRSAKPSDSQFAVPLIIQAMGELAAKFANSNDPTIIFNLFEHFFKQKENQYSYQNTLVFTADKEILGTINAYDGGMLLSLRNNFIDYLSDHHPLKNFYPEPETQQGEFYLDTISVHPKAQGKGIGKALIKAGINWGEQLGHRNIGLLVDQNNKRALKLYEKSGFIIKNEKTFTGGEYYHMVYTII